MKVRHVDLYADEFLAGIVGMPLEEIAAYFVVCLLIYSSGGPIPIDDSRLHGFGGGRRCGLATLIKRVIARGKLDCKDTAQGVHISCKRAALELQRASKRTAQSVQNGSKGGRPKKEDQRVAKPDGSGGEKLTNQLTNLPTNQLTNSPKKTLPRQPSGFETFYGIYPRHVGKGAAFKAYIKALTKTDSDKLIQAATSYRAQCEKDGIDAKFIAHPATWLNAERWQDELALPPPRRPFIEGGL